MTYHEEEFSSLKADLKELNQEVTMSPDFNLKKTFKELVKLEKQFILKIKKTKPGQEVFKNFCKSIKINNSKL